MVSVRVVRRRVAAAGAIAAALGAAACTSLLGVTDLTGVDAGDASADALEDMTLGDAPADGDAAGGDDTTGDSPLDAAVEGDAPAGPCANVVCTCGTSCSDGGCVPVRVVGSLGAPAYLALSGSNVYWDDTQNKTVTEVADDGGAVATLASTGSDVPAGLA